MQENLLHIESLAVSVEEKDILKDINLDIKKGEVHVIMGPNGAGKSTLGHAIMGNPRYSVEEGKILFKGEDITEESPDKRAKAGLYISFQNPLEVPGISLLNFVRIAKENVTGERTSLYQFHKEAAKSLQALHLDIPFVDRDLNVGFSGGEKKKSEIFQLLVLKPELAILDETDSGLDVDAVRIVSEGVKQYQETCGGSLLIITHSTRILQSLDVDHVHILVNGRIVESGGAELIERVNNEGFERYLGEGEKEKVTA